MELENVFVTNVVLLLEEVFGEVAVTLGEGDVDICLFVLGVEWALSVV